MKPQFLIKDGDCVFLRNDGTWWRTPKLTSDGDAIEVKTNRNSAGLSVYNRVADKAQIYLEAGMQE